MKNTEITDNNVSSTGGGIYLSESELVFTNCSILNNRAGMEGGGMYAQLMDINLITEL